MPKILFDVTQKERGAPTTVYTTLKNILENMGAEVSIYSEYPIREAGIRGATVLVIGCPTDSKFSQAEIDAIVSFVRNGGSLLVLSNAGGDSGNRSNLNELIGYFGIKLNTDQVLDTFSNLGVESMPVLQVSATHPILENVTEICYRSGCSLTTEGEALPLIFTSPHSQPPSMPILAVAEYHKGRVLVIGSYSIFRDALKGGIETKDNKQLAINSFKWLMEKAGAEVVATIPKGLEERVAALEKEVRMLKEYIKEVVKIFSAATMGEKKKITPSVVSEPKVTVQTAPEVAPETTETVPEATMPSPETTHTLPTKSLPVTERTTPTETSVTMQSPTPPSHSSSGTPSREELERELEELSKKLEKGMISKTEYAKERARIKRMLSEM
ncbi:MAG: hypothetical protein QXL15_03660 [Candidatus Korarchaeota archaeon]